MRDLVLASGALLLVVGLAGCIGSDEARPAEVNRSAAAATGTLGFTEPTVALDECTYHCKEPTVAVDPAGRVFVAEHLAENGSGPLPGSADGMGLVRSTDGGETFEALGAPPMPDSVPPQASQGDSLVQIGPDGSLYFSALVYWREAAAVYGVQVARSDDGGATWAANTFVAVTEDEHRATIQADRQWLGFGEDGTVYLSYTHAHVPLGIFVQRSHDRGETWSQPSVVATNPERLRTRGGQAGPPVADSQGTVHLPLGWNTLDPEEPKAVRVASSTDGGSSWQHQEALRLGSSCNIPVLVVDDRDRLHLAVDTCEAILVSTSADGGSSWSEPTEWARDPVVGPWIATHEGRLLLAYHQDEGDTVSLHVASRPLDAEPGTGPTERVEIDDGLPSAHTDFTHMATGPEGPWVSWSDEGAGEIRLAGPGEGSG